MARDLTPAASLPRAKPITAYHIDHNMYFLLPTSADGQTPDQTEPNSGQGVLIAILHYATSERVFCRTSYACGGEPIILNQTD